jgi:hypothetical protein
MNLPVEYIRRARCLHHPTTQFLGRNYQAGASGPSHLMPNRALIEARPLKQTDTFDLRRLREDFGADSGFTDAQLLAGLTVPAILDPSRRSIPEDEVIERLPVPTSGGRGTPGYRRYVDILQAVTAL